MYVIIDITMESSFDSDVGIFQNSAFVLQLKVLRGGRGGGGCWQRPLILPLFGFPWSPQLRNLSIVRELQRACAKHAENNSNIKKFVLAAIRQWKVNSLLVLLVIGFFAVNDFLRSNVGLTFSFLLVLRLSLHAVYYATERDQWTVIVHVHVPRCSTFWLTTGFQAVFLFRRPTRLEEGPTLQCVCRRVYIFKWKAEN